MEFPPGELIEPGCIQRPDSEVDDLSKIHVFIGVGSVEAWNLRYGGANLVYRRSWTVSSNEKALATWRRLGELPTDKQEGIGLCSAATFTALDAYRPEGCPSPDGWCKSLSWASLHGIHQST